MAALTTTLVRASRQQLAPAVSIIYTDRRYESTNVYREQASNLAAYRRGRGGRSSFSGIVTTVFGGNGFVGRYIVNSLGKIGSQVIVPYRGDPYDVKDLKLAGDLGQILFNPFHIEDDESIRKCLQYSNVVINLVGRDWETKNFSFQKVNVEGPARIARIAREAGVDKFIHFSHLNAQPNPPAILKKGGSKYLSTKYEGEQLVRQEFPDATIIRPAPIYGPEDRFLRYYASYFRRSLGNMPLWKKGQETVKMPVFVGDVVQGVVNTIFDPDYAGRVIEAVGPEKFYLSEIIDYMYRVMRYDNFKRTHILPDYWLKAWYLSTFPRNPPTNLDRLSQDHVSDITHHLPTLEDLGVKLVRFQDRVPYELRTWKKHSYYEEVLGEFDDPAPPIPIHS